MSLFALAAFLLASLGIYGVTSYSVRERTVEIGTRMAVGARRRDLLRLVLGDGFRMAVYGILIGIPAATGAAWFVVRYLGVRRVDILPYSSSAVLFASVAMVTSVAMVASFLPAWRATTLSPMVALRGESESLWATGRRSFRAIRWRGNSDAAERLAPSLPVGFIDASRRAESFSHALALVLGDLREAVHAQSAMLFENVTHPGFQYFFRAASPPQSIAGAIPVAGFLAARLKSQSYPLAFATGEIEAVLAWARQEKTQNVAELECLLGIGLRLAAPLQVKNEIAGLLLLGPPVEPRESYGRAGRELVQVCAQQLALLLENARLTGRVVEQEKVRRDVALAAEVQERLLPQKSVETSFTSIAAFTLPARTIGGDCFDFVEFGPNQVGIALADVAGKGVAAALIMAALQTSLRIITADREVSPSQLAARMNDVIFRATGAERYATFFYARIDGEKRQLHYVNAGHNPPFLIRTLSPQPDKPSQENFAASIVELKTGGTVIGMFPAADYNEDLVELRPGDVLLAFTDGVTEALNPSQEEFGEVRLKNLLHGAAHLPVKEIVVRISLALRAWIADAPQHDDLTFIVAKMN
jgi:serine phosphatase RsbU (regulator of sigma subunit)